MLMMSLVIVLLGATVQAPQRNPDADRQREAMKKLGFLVGQWAGEGHMLNASGEWIQFHQTESAEYKLNGLLMVIEGVGTAKKDARKLLQAYAVLSFDDVSGNYRMRAFNDGRWLESDVALASNGKELTWGFAVGDVRTKSMLRITDAGDWTETHEIVRGTQPAKRFMELTVTRK